MNVARPVLLALALLAPTGPAVAASCQIGASDLVFGPYRFNSDVDVESSATISIDNCVDDGTGSNVSYTISIGTGSAGTFAPRTMGGPGSGLLRYNVYADPARTQVWGDGTGGTVTVSDGFVLPATTSASHTAFGLIPAHQSDVSAGLYADQLAITITY